MKSVICAVALLAVFAECGEDLKSAPVPGVIQQELEEFIAEIKARQVFVQGGEFLMGDFGSSHGEEGIQLDFNSDSKPLHAVALSSYYIDKYKVTNEDFDFYLRYRGYVRRTDVHSKTLSLFRTHPRLPANLDWFEAEKYCAWLAEITGFPFSLATEAQWEYAARSRGQFQMVATDDGTYKYGVASDGNRVGINISNSWSREEFARGLGWDTRWLTPLPVDHYPPNALGVYSMSDGGREWVKDWYDPGYYNYSSVKDPQGPEEAVHKDHLGLATKVMRGQSLANDYWTVGINVHRFPTNPYGYTSEEKFPNLAGLTSRCVINTQGPIN